MTKRASIWLREHRQRAAERRALALLVARRDWRLLVGGLLMLANWPWTLIMIAPINAALLATSPEAAGAETRGLIEQWGGVHAVRTAFSAGAALLYAWAAIRFTKAEK